MMLKALGLVGCSLLLSQPEVPVPFSARSPNGRFELQVIAPRQPTSGENSKPPMIRPEPGGGRVEITERVQRDHTHLKIERTLNATGGLVAVKILVLEAEGEETKVRLNEGTMRRWEARLVRTPHEGIVADSGNWVALFSYARDGEAVALYGPGGALVKKLALEDFLSEKERKPLEVMDRFPWAGFGKGQHFFDEAKGVLVLSVASGIVPPIYEQPPMLTKRIELKTGRLLP